MTFQQQREDFQQSFLDSVYVISHSNNTIKGYKTRLNLLREFLKERYGMDEYDLLDQYKQEKLDILKIFKEYVIFMDKTGRGARTIHNAISVAKGYFRHMGIKFDSEDLKHVVKMPRAVRIREMPLDKEIILRLLRNAKPKLQLAILMAASTGMRIGEIVRLKISDVDFNENPVKIYIRGETTKTRESRECYLTAEAINALKDYIKRYHDWFEGIKDPRILDKHIFATVYRKRGPFLAESIIKTLQTELRELVRAIPDLSVKDENGRQSIHLHSFRKYFRTTVGNVCGRDFAEAIIGHRFYLDTYYQVSDQKKKELFLQAEPHLTISDIKQISTDYKSLKEKYSELEAKFNDLIVNLKMHSIPVPGDDN